MKDRTPDFIKVKVSALRKSGGNECNNHKKQELRCLEEKIRPMFRLVHVSVHQLIFTPRF